MMTGWTKDEATGLEVYVDRETATGRLIGTIRHGKTRQTLATLTPDALTMCVPSNDAIKKACEAAAEPYFQRLKHDRGHR